MIVFGDSTISYYHGIATAMGGGDSGTKDIEFRWKSIMAEPNISDWSFNSTSYSGVINKYDKYGVYTIAYTGGITYAGSSKEDHRYQRPALSNEKSDILT